MPWAPDEHVFDEQQGLASAEAASTAAALFLHMVSASCSVIPPGRLPSTDWR